MGYELTIAQVFGSGFFFGSSYTPAFPIHLTLSDGGAYLWLLHAETGSLQPSGRTVGDSRSVGAFIHTWKALHPLACDAEWKRAVFPTTGRSPQENSRHTPNYTLILVRGQIKRRPLHLSLYCSLGRYPVGTFK